MIKKKLLYIASLVLLALMFVKVSALHVYGHQDSGFAEIENCNLCDSAIENQSAEHLDVTTVFYETHPEPIQLELEPIAFAPRSSAISIAQLRLYGRPPPTLG